MARYKREDIKIKSRPDSPFWYLEWYEDVKGKRKRKKQTTPYCKDSMSQAQLQRIVDSKMAGHNQTDWSLGWMMGMVEHKLIEKRVSDKTVKLYRTALRMLSDVIGSGYDVRKIQKSTIITQVKNHLLPNTKAPTINTYLRTIRSAFNILIDAEILNILNPFRKFDAEPEPKERPFIDNDEAVEKFLSSLDNGIEENHPDAEYMRLARILFFTGVRRSEVLLIDRDDIDITSDEKFFKAVNIKTKLKVKRELRMHDEVVEDFRYFLNKYPRQYPLRICHPDTLTHRIKEIFCEAGLPDNLHTHSIRHTFGTRMINSEGVDIRDVGKYLGHTNRSTTELYLHDVPNKGRQPNVGLL